MDALTLFGLLAVTLMLLFYALESRGPGFVLGFAAACALGSVYGFLQGAWPFGVVEAVWSLVALNRWRHRAAAAPTNAAALRAPTDARATGHQAAPPRTPPGMPAGTPPGTPPGTPTGTLPGTRPGNERRGFARR